jgi:hypothetical protein
LRSCIYNNLFLFVFLPRLNSLFSLLAGKGIVEETGAGVVPQAVRKIKINKK